MPILFQTTTFDLLRKLSDTQGSGNAAEDSKLALAKEQAAPRVLQHSNSSASVLSESTVEYC